MEIQLDRFEEQINEVILQRGLNYFRKGYVTDVEEIGYGDYEATVEGSDLYTVHLHIEKGIVTEYDCDCPYDQGPVCKHIAAVLFYLQQDVLHLEEDHPTKKAKKPSEMEQVDKILHLLPHEELKAFVRDYCKKDKQVRGQFLFSYMDLCVEQKELYSQQIQALIKSYSGRYGFIEYRDAANLGRSVCGLLDKAADWPQRGKTAQAIYLAEATIEKMADVINNTDDSSGEIGGCISTATQMLADLAESGLVSPLREELFQWAIKQSKSKTLQGWDWHFEVIRIAIDLIQSPQEKEQLLRILKKIQTCDENSWNYQQILNLRLQIIRKTENEEAAIRFMEANLSNPTFRKLLIEKALSEKNYPQVEKLANEGIKQDEKSKPGLAADWKNYLLTMYLQTGDKEQIIRLARYFLLQYYSRHQPRQYYYDLLKSLISEEQWAAYVDGIIAEICQENKYGAFQPVAEIYIREKQWDKLLAWIRQYPVFYHIEQTEPYLKEMYPQELAALYRDTILKYLESNTGREHYQKCCQYIRRMIKLGARPMATELITQLQTQYRNRRALLEELSKV